MDRLESTKNINQMKATAIRNGGYAKHKTTIMLACAKHRNRFGIDLTPKHL